MEKNPIQKMLWHVGTAHRFWKDTQVAVFSGRLPRPSAVQKAQRMSKDPASRLGTDAGPVELVTVRKGEQVQIDNNLGEWAVFHRTTGDPCQLLLDKNTFLAVSRPRILHFDWSFYRDLLMVRPTYCHVQLTAYYSYDVDTRRWPAPVFGEGCVFVRPGIVHLAIEDQPWVHGQAHCCVGTTTVVLDWDGDTLRVSDIDGIEEKVLWRREDEPPESFNVH
jgi:hypothetical protein